MEEGLKRIKSGPFEGGAYLDLGTGFPVMLVHGFPADHNLWKKQAAELRKKYRLLLPDLPGTGYSPLIDPISIEDMAAFLNAICEQEGLEKYILIGHSMGGYATLAFAEQHPEKLAGWGLFHSSAYPDDEEKKKGRKRSIALMRKYGPEVFFRQMLPNLVASSFRNSHRATLKEMVKQRTEAGTDTLIPYYHAMWERPDRTQTLREARSPVLFFIGKEDVAAPMEDVLKQVSLPPVSEVHLFENVGHLGMIEAPDTATQVLQQFIQFCLSYSGE